MHFFSKIAILQQYFNLEINMRITVCNGGLTSFRSMNLGKIAEELRSEKMEKLIAHVRISKPFLGGRLSEPHRTRIPFWNFTGEHKMSGGERLFKGYTGLVLLEVNRLSSFQEAAALRNELSGYPQVMLAFIGCSGTTVKFLVRFVSKEGGLPSDRDEVKHFHAASCEQALRYFSMQLSRTPEIRTNDVRVLCRASYDPDCFFNEHAQPVVISNTVIAPALSVKPKEDVLLKGKSRVEVDSYLFSVAMQDAFARDLGDDLFAARSAYLVKLAENCFNSGIGEETAVRWTLFHTAFRNCEDEVRLVFKTSYKTEQRFGARPVISKEHKQVLNTIEFLDRRYCFRRNRMKGGVEYKVNSLSIEPYEFVTEEVLNTISIEGLKEGLDVWDRDVKRHVKSNDIPDYYPVDEFLNTLPSWDGKDYIRLLADTVQCKNKEEWRNHFYIWFLGMVATWQKDEKRYANSVLPLLVGSQGCGKSTWCKRILPPELNEYYTDSIDFSKKTDAALSLTRFALINIDEFDSVGRSYQSFLKHIVQKTKVSFRKPFQSVMNDERRYASFIATCNNFDVLSDPTGSRRFICVEIAGDINNDFEINYPQLYAQAVAALAEGERHWFTRDEEQQITENNKEFDQKQPEEELLLRYFAVPAENEPFEWLTLVDIYRYIQKQSGTKLGVKRMNYFGRFLRKYGFEHKRVAQGMLYKLMRVE